MESPIIISLLGFCARHGEPGEWERRVESGAKGAFQESHTFKRRYEHVGAACKVSTMSVILMSPNRTRPLLYTQKD